ncbi:hypothetical protein [Streptomyces sp. SID12501]|uniref:Uncharacterized protein n=1 Tax=Streptomyces sp. SID12501 TaxID=2706042 RepID=A0A6B3BPA9_9ACTN|nr:hypothetical protein [Streptomyces sp. SID12501]NEC86166.1 hypothetical protein [Streptomyces sp. SID12501]
MTGSRVMASCPAACCPGAKAAAKLMLGWVALLWLLEVVDVVSGHALDGLGIRPRGARKGPWRARSWVSSVP